MPTTSKYVLVQKNSNGQYTTYGSVSKSVGNAVNQLGNIVVLTTETMADMKGSGIRHEPLNVMTTTTTAAATTKLPGTTSNDNDDNELRPLAWLNDSNLIKGIVTTETASATGQKCPNSICIVNAAEAHELIEELPHHVVSEEHVATSVLPHIVDNQQQHDRNSDDQTIECVQDDMLNSSVHVNDFQKQFIANANKRLSLQATGSQSMQKVTNFAYTDAEASPMSKEQAAHVFSNMNAIGTTATTTVHVGPSGTTTVVEYKTNTNFKSTAQNQKLFNNVIPNALTTVTATATTTTSNNPNVFKNYATSSVIQSPTTYEAQLSNNGNNNNNVQQVNAVNYVKSDSLSVANGNTYKLVQATSAQTPTLTPTPKQNNANNINNKNHNSNNSTSTSNTTTTIHHPHKKYLREKMSVLNDYSLINTGTDTVDAAPTAPLCAVVVSPSVTNHIVSSCALTKSSVNTVLTGVVNGGHSPVSKSTFYNSTLGNNAALAINCSSSPSSVTTLSPTHLSPASIANSYVAVSSSTLTMSPLANEIPAYTIVNSHQIA